MRNGLGLGVAAGILLMSSTVLAQPEPTTGTGATGTAGATTTTTTETPKASATVSTQTTTTQTAGGGRDRDRHDDHDDAKKDDGITDHERVVGKFGVMYFGVTQQPIGTGNANNVGRGSVNTPVVGVRYWFRERIGIDAGLGFNFFSSSRAVEQNGAEVSTDGPAVSAFALHVGVPIALAYGKHYTFLIVPEANFGYATQSEAAQNVPAGTAGAPDIHRSGLRFDVGARIGSEIQFGFIGIPQLALQASVGLNFRRRVWHTSQETAPAETSSSDGDTSFGTTVQADPWALFVNNVAAIYYFP